jgi:hypothetical protein
MDSREMHHKVKTKEEYSYKGIHQSVSNNWKGTSHICFYYQISTMATVKKMAQIIMKTIMKLKLPIKIFNLR